MHHESINTFPALPTAPTSACAAEAVGSQQLQLEDLLAIDFGMADFNLFSHANILHPYLSLYYLDYFAAISKMNTKLYCTTSLMLSMMSAAQNAEASEERADANSNSSSMASSSGSSYTNHKWVNMAPLFYYSIDQIANWLVFLTTRHFFFV